MMMKHCLAALAVLVVTASAWPIDVYPQSEKQSSSELALAVADAQKANVSAIMNYSWRVKTNLSMEGESKATSITELRFNAEGKLEAMYVGGESSVKKKPGVRGRVQQRKIEDFSEYLVQVLNHAFTYIFMSKGTLVDVFDRAKITETDGTIDVVAAGLFVADDELHLAIESSNNLARKLSFKTMFEGDAVQGAVNMSKIENGPNRPLQLEIEIPAKAVKIVSETYDWIKQK